MDIFLLIIRLFLVAIFALAGIGKLLDLKGSEKAVKDFGVPDGMAKPLAILLPIAELAIAILLLPIQTSWFGAIGGSLLLLTFIGGMLWQMKQGNAPDCHCFGQIHSEPVSKKSLLRNVIFAVLALVLVVMGRGNQGFNIFDSGSNFSEANVMQIIIGLGVLGFLTAIVFLLKTISDQQTQIMRRIEVLELIAHEGGKEVEREDLTDPAEGLPIGSPIPDFEIPDITNKLVTSQKLLVQSKPTLLFFVSPSCGPCEALLPEIESWQAEMKDKLNFAFISSGKVQENVDKFSGDTFKRILLQEETEISELFGAKWTPTALLINADGTIASRIAAGDSAIKELVEKVMAEDLEKDFLFVLNGHSEDVKIGNEAPEFSLEDLKGNEISKKYFEQKKTLVAFWSMGCPHCVNMMDELRDWDKAKGVDDPNLLILSSGEAEAHEDLELESPIVLDNEYEVAESFGLSGTPSAVMVNEKGQIVSETAVGALQIWTLLGKQKSDETD